jgi:hypothetical protein
MMQHTVEYQREWRAAHPEKSVAYSRKHFLYKKYGLTVEEYQKLWEKQKGLCYICKQPERIKDRTGKLRQYLSVDHDHATGKIRSLLCHHCNATLGHCQDSLYLLQKMITYLQEVV